MLEALLLDSARDGFFRLFYRLVPRAALPGYLGPGDGRGPLPKAALNALYNRVFDPAITHRDAFVCHCPGRWAGPTAIEHGPAFSGDMEVETGAVPSRTVMHDPRTKRPVRWVVPSSDSVVDDQKGILGGVIFALAASDGTPSIQSCSSATLTKPLPLVCTAGLVPLWSLGESAKG